MKHIVNKTLITISANEDISETLTTDKVFNKCVLDKILSNIDEILWTISKDEKLKKIIEVTLKTEQIKD